MPTSAGAGLREVAEYLRAMRNPVADALRERQTWVKQLGLLMESARSGNPGHVAQNAGRIGREHVEVFRDARLRVGRLRPPAGCEGCQEAVQGWLDRLVAACEHLVSAGASNEVGRLKDAQEHLAEARIMARRFNHSYDEVLDDLRRSIREAERERARNERRRERERERSRDWVEA